MKHLLLISILFLFKSVVAQKPYAGDGWVVDSTQKITYQKKIVVMSSGAWEPQKDEIAFEVSKVAFEGKKNKELAVTVKYGGGCTIHRFQLVKPVQGSKDVMQLYLLHEAYNDKCKAYIANNLRFETKLLKLNKKVKKLMINNFEVKL